MKTLPCLFPHKRWCPKFKNNPFFLFYSSLAPLSSYLYNPSSTLLFARWGAAWFINCLMKPMRSSDLLNWIFKDYYLFREMGREGEREGEKDQCVRETSIGCLLHAPKWGLGPTTQARALTRNWTGDVLVRRPALNPLSHTSQGWILFFNILEVLSGRVVGSLIGKKLGPVCGELPILPMGVWKLPSKVPW